MIFKHFESVIELDRIQIKKMLVICSARQLIQIEDQYKKKNLSKMGIFFQLILFKFF